MSQNDPFRDDSAELRELGLEPADLSYSSTPPGGRLEAPKPVPQRSVAKTVGGGLLAVLALVMLISAIGNLGHHGGGAGYLVGWLIGLVIGVGLPAWGSWKLLTSHDRELKAWEEQRRLEQRKHGYGL